MTDTAPVTTPASRPNRNVLWIVLGATGGVLTLCCVAAIVAAAILPDSEPRGANGAPAQSTTVSTPPAQSTTAAPSSPALATSVPACPDGGPQPCPGPAGAPPPPDAVTRAAYLADLDAINPEIIGNHSFDTMVSRGRSQCSSIRQYPNDRPKLIELTNFRFTSPDHPNGFGTATAEKILDVVHARLCPTW